MAKCGFVKIFTHNCSDILYTQVVSIYWTNANFEIVRGLQFLMGDFVVFLIVWKCNYNLQEIISEYL